MTELVRYDAMCRAIAEAHAIDEVKDIRDKAMAIEHYAKQAKNTEAETKACEIRLRAERRCGQMVGEMEKARPGRPPNNPSHDTTYSRGAQTLTQLGISRDQSSRWQKLAAIPEDQFEATFANTSKKPSTSGILRDASPPKEPTKEPTPDDRALWLWGRLMDFERQGLLSLDPRDLFDTMLDHMKTTTLELAPQVADWLRRLS